MTEMAYWAGSKGPGAVTSVTSDEGQLHGTLLRNVPFAGQYSILFFV